jgi:hypothetical protein
MRTNILLAMTCLAGNHFCQAQGTVNFANLGSNLNAQVHIDTLAGPLAGAGYMAQLLLRTGGGSLTPVGAPANFIGSTAPGYFNGGVVTVSQVAPGASATFQVFAWDSASVITSYAQAIAAWNGGMLRGGFSFPVTIATGSAGTPPLAPAQLTGLQPWALVGQTIIPEPSVVILSLLGAGALVLSRRR